jgi:Gas vesicle synthesis protein GvpO
MPDKTQEARGRRSQARQRRRGQLEEPVDKVERAAPSAGSGSPGTNGQLGGAAAKVVGTAVAAGLLGVLGGAVKAVLERREAESPSREPEPEAAQKQSDTEAEAEHDVTADEPQPESEDRSEYDRQTEPAAEHAESAMPDRGASEDDVDTVVATARRRLEALLGTDVERVSGLERANGQWQVMLEVVEVARIPESTDVLATYEVDLDEDGDLIGVGRVRRYRRSQVEEEA